MTGDIEKNARNAPGRRNGRGGQQDLRAVWVPRCLCEPRVLGDAYRPITEPGKYTITAATLGYWATDAKPFVLKNAEQFRPGPPPDLKGDIWARDYNEIKEIGEKYSTKRTPKQTETARLWLAAGPIAYNPWLRQIAIAKNMSVTDTARFMALVTIAEADALQSVYDAKWHYLFWRPMTAIRNGDIDDNVAGRTHLHSVTASGQRALPSLPHLARSYLI